MLKKCLLPLLALSAPASAQTLNILLYHHVADDTPAVTSTKVADFIAQLDNFEQQGYEIVDLEQAVKQVQAGKPLEKRSIALTFDDGFKSVCDTAYPELKKRGLPFTVFVTTNPIDDNYQGYCSWDELKEMADNGVTIANHTLDHGHLVSKALKDDNWLEAVKSNINDAQAKLEQKIGHAPMIFAYPYGEYNNELKLWLKEQGYIAFGQQSGSVGTTSDWQALPRFNAAGNYASISSLRFKINASALPLDYATLPDPQTTSSQPELNITLLESNEAYYPHLQCFINGQPIDVSWKSDLEFSVTPPEPLSNGRHRLNCTAPHRNGSPFFWLSQQWLVDAQ
ncbi:polysaccharide deacetylase family protein [Vibrio sp. SCSIO 43135]|uniref:polysaccharide deacetylase family protein n=1 Tax=Vibrio sp. SCSIO 43135 TaxID=2819096 RepID=UPI0020752B72|nr:polysaccharide deacetylase family protein [Vibrio sp. SCSIO 43135]USD43774.1 polysaccharide deacetylase family protein [Vibrio sp. SCSIO 43135]